MASEPERLGGDGLGRPWGGSGTLSPPGPQLRQGLLLDTLVSLSTFLAATTVVAVILAFRVLPLGWEFVICAVVSLALIFAWVIHALPEHPHMRFGPANLVTAFRACLVSLVAAAILFFDNLATIDTALWVVIGAVLFALALDGVDGYLARRYRQESPLGARFDMEIDALLILILSLGAALMNKAGLWVLLIGLMRYGFVAAGWLLPRLNGELLPSFRRKLVCVVQIASLCIILVPVIEPPYSPAIAATALLALVYSFAVDVLYLLRQPAKP